MFPVLISRRRPPRRPLRISTRVRVDGGLQVEIVNAGHDHASLKSVELVFTGLRWFLASDARGLLDTPVGLDAGQSLSFLIRAEDLELQARRQGADEPVGAFVRVDLPVGGPVRSSVVRIDQARFHSPRGDSQAATIGAVWPEVTLDPRTLLLWIGGYALLAGILQFVASISVRRVDAPIQAASDIAVAVGLAWTLLRLWVHRHEPRERMTWLLGAIAMLLLVAVQTTDWLVDIAFIDDDWLIDLPLWTVVTLLMHRVTQHDRRQPWIARLWHLGVVVQIAFIAMDFHDGGLLGPFGFDPEHVATATECLELIAIEAYVSALILHGTVPASVQAGEDLRSLATGDLARRVFEDHRLHRRATGSPLSSFLFWPVVGPIVVTLYSVALVAVLGSIARQHSHRSRFAQLTDMLTLALRHRIDPPSYYLLGLHRAGGLAEASHYLTRTETGNGLFDALNTMLPQPFDGREMRDKLLFAAQCEFNGLRVPDTLMVADSTGVTMLAERESLDVDLLSKPVDGLGARGIVRFKRVGFRLYRAADGETIGLEEAIDRLGAMGRRRALIVQRCLRNHVDVADLCSESLATIRVVTCLDDDGRPQVALALLRVLGALEPQWPVDDEFAASIDLTTGRLGPFASGRLRASAFRYLHHPVTGARVEGRVLQTWEAVRTMALAAHRAFPHRVVIGWDIATTSAGPVLLDGDTGPDVVLAQRSAGEGVGRTSFGRLLRGRLLTLAALEQAKRARSFEVVVP